MSCTKTIKAVVSPPVVSVTFNGDPFWETPSASTSRIKANVTISGAGGAGTTLHYIVDSTPNLDVGLKDGTYDVVVCNPMPTNVDHSVRIEEATCG